MKTRLSPHEPLILTTRTTKIPTHRCFRDSGLAGYFTRDLFATAVGLFRLHTPLLLHMPPRTTRTRHSEALSRRGTVQA